MGSNPRLVKPKAIKQVFTALPLIMQYQGVGEKVSLLGIRIMCQC